MLSELPSFDSLRHFFKHVPFTSFYFSFEFIDTISTERDKIAMKGHKVTIIEKQKDNKDMYHDHKLTQNHKDTQ